MHLKVHLRFHFQKREILQQNVKKKMHLTLQLMVHLMMQSRLNSESQIWLLLRILYILNRAERTELLTFLN